jgi:hypothetical protein
MRSIPFSGHIADRANNHEPFTTSTLKIGTGAAFLDLTS